MRKYLLLAFVAIFLASCHEHVDIEFAEESEKEDFSISTEQALKNLSDFMVNFDVPTRSSKQILVDTIIPIKMNERLTRGNQDNLACKNLLYIANFKDDQGYALLAADERISEKVISVIDNGSMNETTINRAMTLLADKHPIFECYPLTGPGLFTTPETGDEVFLNPNTFSPHNSSVNDYLIGNYIENNNEFSSYQNNIMSTNNSHIASNPDLISCSFCVMYAMEELGKYDRQEIRPADPYYEGSSRDFNYTHTDISPWKTIKQTDNYLSNFKYWHQSSPFNDYYPKKRKFVVVGRRAKAPAGCFPLSIAKVLTHFEYPSMMIYNGHTINWKQLKSSIHTEEGKRSAASLLKTISIGCDCWYFYEGTFTFPANATHFLRSFGFSNAHSVKYSFENVTKMIDKGCPLLIYAVPGKINIFGSHCWNIDGYKIKERTITTNYIVKGEVKSSYSKTERTEMVHCDFGWKGSNNGYYVSGIFNLKDSNIEHDGRYNPNTDNYNGLLRIITYNKPTQSHSR